MRKDHGTRDLSRKSGGASNDGTGRLLSDPSGFQYTEVPQSHPPDQLSGRHRVIDVGRPSE